MKANNKVALLGTLGGFKRAPFHDSSWDKWALNTMYEVLTVAELESVSRWFELHPHTALTQSRRPDSHWLTLDALNIPIYSFYELPNIRNQCLFPLEDIERTFSPFGASYFACTFSYQIALAIMEGYTTIGIYGAPLTYAREGLVERPCVERWLGFAEGRGLSVVVEHDEPEGLYRHAGRYAKDDHKERYGAYVYTLRHAQSIVTWLVNETKRLNLSNVGYGDQ